MKYLISMAFPKVLSFFLVSLSAHFFCWVNISLSSFLSLIGSTDIFSFDLNLLVVELSFSDSCEVDLALVCWLGI